MNHTVNHIISINHIICISRETTLSCQTMITHTHTHTSPIEGHWLTHTRSTILCCLFGLFGTCAIHTPLLSPTSSTLLEFFYEKETFLLMSHASNQCNTLSAWREMGREDYQLRKTQLVTDKPENEYAHIHTCSETGHITSLRPRNAAPPYVSCTTCGWLNGWLRPT